MDLSFDSAAAKPSFYIEKVLVPTLRHGDIVIMDNLGSHKANAVRRAIRAAGAQLFYLPKYSPDLNPSEQFVVKLKPWLRKAAQRTTEAVYDATALILDAVSPAECANSAKRDRATSDQVSVLALQLTCAPRLHVA
jgi:transposase